MLIDGLSLDAPATWLRLQCPCASCFVPGIGERRLTLSEVPLDLAVADQFVDDGGVTVIWNDGHTSRYDMALLRLLRLVERRRMQHEPRLWSGGHELPTVDDGAFWGDDALRSEALASYRDEGVLVVTGMSTEPGECGRWLERLGVAIREVPFARIHDIEYSLDGYNIAFTADPLPPHTDLASYTWPPSGQLLAMLQNSADGGDSIVVDGWNVVDQLRADDPAAFTVLAEVPVPHRIYSDEGETFSRQPIVRVDPAGAVVGVRYSNQTLQPLPLDEPRLDEWYSAYRALTERILDSGNQVHRRLDAGQMLMVHGHRVLHGRTGFSGAEARRHLQDAYFEFDDVVNRLDRLEGVAPT